MVYEGDIYRPPSEARSLIIQMTVGCARNNCTFCSMYKSKDFRIRSEDEVIKDLREAQAMYGRHIARIFLADGDALIVRTGTLLNVLNAVRELFPYSERTTVYGAPKDVLLKSDEELKALRNAGMSIVYMGAESGDPEILAHVRKGATREEIIEAGQKLEKNGIAASITLISGLGGRERMKEHAVSSATLISEIKPAYVGLLTLMLPKEAPLREEFARGSLTLLSPDDVMEEMRLFLENVDSEGTVFRANHASNYVPLRGTLNKDIPKMLSLIKNASENNAYRPEYYRGL
ncbi:MAG: B12-binding domain-containing radical SAM protein [Lachnospiraceae bacterium]|nr:B12-binding domain-containing radical SAM protein [Lachnospiraceae bacterium]